MLKQVFLADFEHVLTYFGAWKIPKRLRHEPFWHRIWVKIGFKTYFFKKNWHAQTRFSARCEPMVTRFGPPNIAKCLENGLFWHRKGVKNC